MFKFYENMNHYELFCNILTSKNISLRTIDWFITTWSNQNRTILYWNGLAWSDKQTKNHDKQAKNEIIYINIYGEYINNLNTYSKKYFDIFRRRNNSSLIKFMNVNTNLAQLIFCKWLIESKIAQYILSNQEYINTLYKQYNKDIKPIIKMTSDKSTKYKHEIQVCIN